MEWIQIYKKILVGVDGSEDSMRAAKRALEISKGSGAFVTIFHSTKHRLPPQKIPIIIPPFTTDRLQDYSIPDADYDKVKIYYEVAGKKILEETLKIFKDAKNFESKLVVDYEPTEFVKEFAKKDNYDLVIIGCKGHHSKLREIFIGTVAEKLSSDAPCDVLLVR